VAGPKKTFSDLVLEAERRFGSRTRPIQYEVVGRQNLIPESVFAGGIATIYFASEARHDFFRLRFQLAHEAVHYICGGFRRDTTKLEEGLAVHFSLTLHRRDPDYDKRSEASLPAMFTDCLSLFRQARMTDAIVEEIRASIPNLDNLAPSDLVRFTEERLAQTLCERVSHNMEDRN
jgi:hypothetical protein